MGTRLALNVRGKVGFCIGGIPRPPLIEFETLIEILSLMRDAGILGRVVYSTWHEETENASHIVKKLRDVDAIIIEGDAPQVLKRGWILQHVSLIYGLSMFADKEYVVRGRTDYYLDELMSFLKSPDFSTHEELIAVKLGSKIPFMFSDRVFAGPAGMLRRCMNRDLIFEESKVADLPQPTFFSHRYFHEFPLTEYACAYVGWATLHSALERAVQSGCSLPDAIARLYGFYLHVLKRDFNPITSDRHDATNIAEFFLDMNRSCNRRALLAIARDLVPGAEPLRSVAQWLNKFEKEGLVGEERVRETDYAELQSFFDQHVPNAPRGILPQLIATTPLQMRTDSSPWARSLAEEVLNARASDGYAFSNAVKLLAQRITDASAHDHLLIPQAFLLASTVARDWDGDAFAMFERLHAIHPLTDEQRTQILELAEYLCRPGRDSMPAAARFIISDCIDRLPYVNKQQMALATWSLRNIKTLAESAKPEWFLAFMHKVASNLGLHCPLCGVSSFKPMPSGRMAGNGEPPLCANCGSREHQRVLSAQMISLVRRHHKVVRGLIVDNEAEGSAMYSVDPNEKFDKAIRVSITDIEDRVRACDIVQVMDGATVKRLQTPVFKGEVPHQIVVGWGGRSTCLTELVGDKGRLVSLSARDPGTGHIFALDQWFS